VPRLKEYPKRQNANESSLTKNPEAINSFWEKYAKNIPPLKEEGLEKRNEHLRHL